ncbi:MAG TPA: NAD(P)(+) transhydrogenase (Re/Si-specific) subunit beta [Propionibacteriaceae bacterium]|nr:NAD(P)(+) transhydrogenase (Re/Si-specific) subunit beta [Propionibacteriaceae bacterium]
MSTPVWAQLGYLVAAVAFIVALKGLSSPRTARRGNLIGAAGAVLATVIVFAATPLDNLVPILIALAIGTAVGAVGAYRVQMTQMPQLVALFNGVGGGAAAIVALIELDQILSRMTAGDLPDGAAPEPFSLAVTAFTLLVGAASFTGSMVTFLKLQELMTTRPVTFPGYPIAYAVALLAAIGLAVALVISPGLALGVLLILVGGALGVLLVLPVGGADVPIVISLLNAFTGLTVAASGYLLENTLLLVAGTLVGSAGTLLTRLMANAMGRSLFSTLFGALKGGSTQGSTQLSDRPVKAAGAEDVAILLAYAERVIIVPGYGLAVAQAQHALKQLVDVLLERGAKVDYAIHPVAGRMPGHMNVLLAEAQVPYEQLKEMDDINPEFKQADVVLVVGANDVVNPAAETTPGAPIYGMPILHANQARQVVFMKRSMRPGFAGIENELLYEPTTTLLFGDAKDTMGKLLAEVKALRV